MPARKFSPEERDHIEVVKFYFRDIRANFEECKTLADEYEMMRSATEKITASYGDMPHDPNISRALENNAAELEEMAEKYKSLLSHTLEMLNVRNNAIYSIKHPKVRLAMQFYFVANETWKKTMSKLDVKSGRLSELLNTGELECYPFIPKEAVEKYREAADI